MLSWLALCTLALGGCAATGPTYSEPELPPVREGTIARLRVDGPNAYINRRPVQGVSYVVDGDTVTTGPGTSALLVLNQGGEIQLDENTDPLFRQGACLLMKILRGRVAFRNLKCQQFEDGLQMAGVAHSYVHIASSESASRVTVIEGQVEMRSPGPATLGKYAEYVATREGAVQVLQLTEAEALARVAWTRNYFRPPAAQQSTRVSPWGAAAIGVGLGVILDRMLGRDSSPRQEPPREPRNEPAREPQPEPPPPAPSQPPPPPPPEPLRIPGP
jgi:hypothetical protein